MDGKTGDCSGRVGTPVRLGGTPHSYADSHESPGGTCPLHLVHRMRQISTSPVRRRQQVSAPPGVLPILALLTLAGCAQLESPVAPPGTIATLAPASANLVTRPWEGRCEGTGAFRPDFITLDITGTCHLSHLGLTTTVGVEITSPSLSAVHTFTAANGDKLYTTTVGQATLKPDFSGVTFSNIETVTGGTGRFTNASGSATRIGSTNFADASATWEIVGTLTYDAADRK